MSWRFLLQQLHHKLQVWEKVAKKLQVVATSKTKGRDFKDDIVERIPEDPVDKLPSVPIIIGQKTIFDQVWGCLKEEHKVGIIGLYGNGGVGKTTILTQINNKLSDEL
ncbi:hypothetical protein LWI28_006946 [Acer negundo]|uniref:NB-ARC domain-containing protein n=1 Tax=Acer negundo TaxID=4023 RepID=A0AAD5ICJ3_ACENE|nr:hypothetical protein LWI28_006946 [Acer negundo]